MFAKGLFKGPVHLDQCARDSVTHGAGLTGNATAFSLHVNVETARALRCLEGLANDLLQLRTRKVFVDRLLIDNDDALAQRQFDAGDRALTAASGLNVVAVVHAVLLEQRLGLLRVVRMRFAFINLQATQLLVAHTVGREHTANGHFNETFGMLVVNFTRRLRT